jgi:hypothetical protein
MCSLARSCLVLLMPAVVQLASIPLASAQEPEPTVPGTPTRLSYWSGLEEWSASVVDVDGRWRGPRVPFPASVDRPSTAVASYASLTLPISVHADPGVSTARALAVLEGAEAALLAIGSEGWPLPNPDGGREATAGLDLYLRADSTFTEAPSWVPSEHLPIERLVRVAVDGPLPLADTDAASTFGELASDIADDRLFACGFQAVAEAALLGSDVAEAPSVRRGVAVWLTERFTGVFGCDEQRVIDQQLAPERGFFTHEPDSGEGGAIFLGALSDRHDREAGTFLSALWNGTRQWTRDGGDPYGLPDFWWVVGMALTRAEDDLLRFVRELGVARYFAGTRSGSRFPWLDRLPAEATVPLFVESRWERLPRALVSDAEVEPYGSAYARIDVRGAPEGSYLRVWLEGEFGVQWSLGATRVDATGRDVSHSFVPSRNEPRAYQPIELLPGTAEVVLVVTNLGARALDADEPEDHMRSFRLVVDRGAR